MGLRKARGLMPDVESMQDFQESIMEAQLSEISYEGKPFTWCNNQTGNRWIWQQLDRVLGNGAAFTQLSELKVRHLPGLVSDHAPLLIQLAPPSQHRSKFIFQRMWLEHPEFMPLVEQVWGEEVRGCPSLRVAEKLRRLKQKLKTWNWHFFGDLKIKIKELQDRVSELEDRVQQGGDDADENEFQKCSAELRQALGWEADLIYQKTRAN